MVISKFKSDEEYHNVYQNVYRRHGHLFYKAHSTKWSYSTCFVFNLLTDGTLQLPETNVAFAISATGTEAHETHKFIKDIIKSIITTYGIRKLQYSVIVYGDSVSPEVTFGDIFKSNADLIKAIDSIPGVTGSPSFDKALEEAKEQLMSPFLRPYAAKVGSLHCDLVFTYPYIFENKDFSTFSIKCLHT